MRPASAGISLSRARVRPWGRGRVRPHVGGTEAQGLVLRVVLNSPSVVVAVPAPPASHRQARGSAPALSCRPHGGCSERWRDSVEGRARDLEVRGRERREAQQRLPGGSS